MIQGNTFRPTVLRHRPKLLMFKRLFGLGLYLLFYFKAGYGQGVPQVGSQLEFAGVTIHLTGATQHIVQQEAELLYVNRALVTARLERMNLYFPIIRPLLAQHSLSDDFLFLALHDPASVADKPSAEFWAMNNTRPKELRMDAFVDERLHPVRSTLAAINRLKQLYQRKSNWVLVVHRYDQELRSDTVQARTKETVDSKTYALNDTRDAFLIKLLASKIVLERAISVYHSQKQVTLFPYEETMGKSLQQIAANCQVSEAAVTQYNTWLKAPRVPDTENYTVYVPATLEQYAELKQKTGTEGGGQLAAQDAGFPVLQKSKAVNNKRPGLFYQINGKKGIQAQLFDNRITLAYQGKIKVKKFEEYNDLRDDRPIVAGEIYYLEKKSKRANVPFHIVRRGQSLWAIAQQYGIKLQNLIDYNGVNPDQQPAVSRILWLQKKRPANQPVEYYRSPKQPDQLQPAPQTGPVLVAAKPDSANKKTAVSIFDTTVRSKERMAVVQKTPPNVPSGSTLAALDSMIAALNNTEVTAFRSGATKMIQPTTSEEKLAEEEPEEVSGPLIMHIVEKTDTYAIVARKYNVTVQQLYVWNNLSPQKLLRPGQPLLIDQSKLPTTKNLVPLAAKPASVKPPVTKPVPTPNPVPPSATKPATPPSAESTDDLIHIVQAGENMYRIGLRYKVKPEQVKQWNNLPDLTAVVGARLIIRKK